MCDNEYTSTLIEQLAVPTVADSTDVPVYTAEITCSLMDMLFPPSKNCDCVYELSADNSIFQSYFKDMHCVTHPIHPRLYSMVESDGGNTSLVCDTRDGVWYAAQVSETSTVVYADTKYKALCAAAGGPCVPVWETTHLQQWLQESPERLATTVRKLLNDVIEDVQHERPLTICSVWGTLQTEGNRYLSAFVTEKQLQNVFEQARAKNGMHITGITCMTQCTFQDETRLCAIRLREEEETPCTETVP